MIESIIRASQNFHLIANKQSMGHNPIPFQECVKKKLSKFIYKKNLKGGVAMEKLTQTQQTQIQAQQTQTQEGGEAMRKGECRYEVEEREYCNRARLGNVYVEGFQHDDVYELDNVDEEIRKVIDALPELDPVMELQEPCDCWEKYGGPMHNDGGNYHSRIRVFEITPCVYLAVFGDTRRHPTRWA